MRLSAEDLRQIAAFNKIVMNYMQMCRLIKRTKDEDIGKDGDTIKQPL